MGLNELVSELIRKSAAIRAFIHLLTYRGIVGLVRKTNIYYSNLRKGHNIHLIDIERPM